MTNWLLTLTEASAFLLLLLVITPLIQGLYRRFLSTPKLEVSLDSIVSTSDVQEVQKYLTTPSPQIPTEVIGRGGNLKTQAIHVKASRATVHQCKAKITADGHSSGYLLWVTEDRPQGSQRTNLIPEEDDLLIIWKAFKTNEKEELILNTEEQVPLDLRKLKEKSLDFEITFLGEEWSRRQKPYRLRLNVESWDKLGLEMIKD